MTNLSRRAKQESRERLRPRLYECSKVQLFATQMFGLADFAAKFACAAFHCTLSLHAAVADHTAGFLFNVTFEFSCASARPIFAARFHTQQYRARAPLFPWG